MAVSQPAGAESYLGPWFPGPLIGSGGAEADPADVVTLDESVRMALLIVQEVAHGVMRFFGAASGTTLLARDVNGEPGIIALRDGVAVAVLALTLKTGAITRIYVVADPRKLAHVRRALDQQQ